MSQSSAVREKPKVKPPSDQVKWPAPPGREAFHGIAGQLVSALEPASEADPVALLAQLLAGFGSEVGRSAYFQVEGDRHFTNEFFVLVGSTSRGRKGTSWGRIKPLLAGADAEWADERVQTGLSSGEGVVWSVRDAISKSERVKERGKSVRYEMVQVDPGIQDKRLLIMEPEFANVLRQIERQSNTLSAVLRLAWDGAKLQTLTKNSPGKATGAHVSLVGHITGDELRRYLTTTEVANGFANRILWLCVRRSKELPEGGRVDEAALTDIAGRLARGVAFAKTAGEMRRDEETREIWRGVYGQLTADTPGLAGAMTARAEAHAVRLSLLYALLDCSPVIRAEHLLAALALVDYISRSAQHIFGSTTGDKLVDELRSLLQAAPGGLSRTDISAALGRHYPAERIEGALSILADMGEAVCERVETGGRSREVWKSAA